MNKRKMRRNQLLLFLFTAGMLVATVLVQSAKNSPDKETFLTPDTVCDSALNKQAARSFGSNIFKDSIVDDSALHSFSKVADALARDAGKVGRRTVHRLCDAESPGGSNALLTIDFAWGKSKSLESFPTQGEPMQFKEFDALIFEYDARTGFPCPVDGKASSQNDGALLQVVAGALFSKSAKEHKEAAYILHSVSVKMAEEMGCLKESGLPKKLDHLTLVPTKATKK
ncbi:hypothetical protein [Streptomyces sp. ME19-01-6]|uniref:hypothetical protein n=1 Tax=Streptomyces sp. ME19-01-6 TaxID=3028686 RepID=UPI0029A46C7E|nr:hypothetical protein [Streptomyces sp. ME19-01-6]MDX3231313.1 hypothetical protein [Streptomyces sp. ME19-01-6]